MDTFNGQNHVNNGGLLFSNIVYVWIFQSNRIIVRTCLGNPSNNHVYFSAKHKIDVAGVYSEDLFKKQQNKIIKYSSPVSRKVAL